MGRDPAAAMCLRELLLAAGDHAGLGLQPGKFVGGAVLTETVFAWADRPLAVCWFEAISQRDYRVMWGSFSSRRRWLCCLFNLIHRRPCYVLVDPRIRLT